MFVFCGILLFQVFSPLIKPLIALYFLTSGGDGILWNSIYCSPCGLYKDFGSSTIEALCSCGEDEKAMQLLAIMLKKKHTQENWNMVSWHLKSIDREGKVSGARWMELSEPFAAYQMRLFAEQSLSPDPKMALSMLRTSTINLAISYENHKLLDACESLHQKLVDKEIEVNGIRSYRRICASLALANFYERHGQREKAKALIDNLRLLERSLDEFGIYAVNSLPGKRYQCRYP